MGTSLNRDSRAGRVGLRVLLVPLPLGSQGDVQPMISVGRWLNRNGHTATVIANGYFESTVREAGVRFIRLGEPDLIEAVYENRTMSNPKGKPSEAAKESLNSALSLMGHELYRIIEKEHVPGQTAIAASPYAFGALVAQESRGIPLATVYPVPASLCARPRWLGSLVRYLGSLLSGARIFHAANRLRSEFGLPAAREVDGWYLSPRRVIGLFPDWFVSRQPWPAQTLMTGFPLDTELEARAIPEDLGHFLDGGDAPLVFTTSSWLRGSRHFFEASAEACCRLGKRGVILTGRSEDVPSPLPDSIQHHNYVPLGRLLPRSAAIVHNGGVGTVALALAAGIPQLVVPLSTDQPYNARRVGQLGLGMALKAKAYDARTAARALNELLDSPGIASRCSAKARKIAGDRGLDNFGMAIEELCPRQSTTE